MSNNKAERDYKSALARLAGELAAASRAAHALTQGDSEEDQEDHRTFALGWIVRFATRMCPAHVRVLEDLASELVSHQHDHDKAEGEEATPSATEH